MFHKSVILKIDRTFLHSITFLILNILNSLLVRKKRIKIHIQYNEKSEFHKIFT